MRPSAAACSFSIGWDVGGWNCDKNGKSRDALVNAVAHRDYASRGSVQVMLFADRLEVWNPGRLPSSLTLARLRKPHGSVPHNPLLAEPLYLTQYIERMGTGTGDMIRRCREAGLQEPKFEMVDGFTLTLWRTKDSSVGVKPSGKMSGILSVKMSGKIVLLIKEKPDITIPELAGRLRRTERTIERLINRLKSDEIIGRVGPAKGGHWEVLK
jgi:predicted HTH transcriptional regulator